MKKYQINKQKLNTDNLGIIELYLKGKETELNPVIDTSEILGTFATKKDAWKVLEKYNSAIEKSGRGHRLTEYVVEEVTYDEDGEPSEYKFVDRAEFKGLTIWQLQEVSAAAPKRKADWCNGMVTDADSAHVIKELEPLEWFLSKADAMAALKFHDCYVDQFAEAHEFRVEECIVGDLEDEDTWNWAGSIDVGNYPYIKVYAESRYSNKQQFIELFDSMEDADWTIDEEWMAENLDEDIVALHYINMEGEEIKKVKF